MHRDSSADAVVLEFDDTEAIGWTEAATPLGSQTGNFLFQSYHALTKW